jgi:chemosensory pili system protein ChpA (sensor histidine kinase/response regulator)
LTSDSDIEKLLPPAELDMSDPSELLPSEILDSVEHPVDASAHSRPAPEFDTEIAAIFAEEATEILEAADKEMEQLSADARDPEPLVELQRHLHTLKGGARMAGVVTMGDFSHELESLLLRIIQGGMVLDDAGYSLMQASFDELHRMHDQVLTGVIDPPGAELLERLAMAVEATMMMPVLDPVSMQRGDKVDSDAIDATPADKAIAIPIVPEPEKLGELARELIQGKAPDKPRPLPNSILPGSPRQAVSDFAAPRREVTRVDAAMLEEMLNNAGEISISHSRLNQQLGSIQFNLEELGTTVSRLQQQLRFLEMETEAQILFKHQTESTTVDDFDPLEMDRYSTIQQLSRALVETANDVNSIKELLRNLASDAETILLHQKRTTSAMQNSLMRTRMVPFDQHVPRLSRLVRQQATEAGKQVELKVEGSSGELDRQVMEKMLPPFEHMLRNAIIHGIETPDIRAAAGKSETGTITIRFQRQGSEVLINIIDDGAGLDLDAVRNKALERGVLQPDQSINDEELAQLIFHSGLSTASQLTQSAGRGIGMDVVVSEVAKLGGRLTIQTEAGKSCTFTVRLPYTLAITQAFIVRLGNESFALPVSTVEAVTRISRQKFEEIMREDVPVVEHRGRHYRLRHLGMFVGLGAAKLVSAAEHIPLILVDAGDNSTALIVDETADHREIVVKPIGALLSAIRGVSGATILGDGSIVMILDVGAIVRDARIPAETDIPVEIVEDHLPPLALVVDDSITMRRVTQRLLERNGLRVLTAKDGVEALGVLQEKIPDIIVLDIEMPRMDGYELAKHVRNSQSTAKLPIIMVTSRVGEKHRARAIELGVNDYLGKPYQEHEMLDAIRNILGDDIFEPEGSAENDE